MIRRSLLPLALLATMTACAADAPAGSADASPAPATAAAPTAAPAGAAVGDEAIRTALQALVPGLEIGAITDSPIPGYRQVALGARVVYVSEDARLLLQGSVIEIASRESLTGQAEAALRRDMLAGVGDDSRITFAAAQPKHVVTVFTDIDCGYCRRMHSEIAEYNRLGITVNYLFYPRAGIGSESYQKAVNVWCSADRQKALTDAKAGKDLPEANCTSPVTRDYDLGRRVGLDGTPAIYAADGTQLGGYVPPAEMLARLEELAGKQAR
ncbi:thioredoxin fold domain-containing protein [Arenimonas caeni]|jgi:thiol:disulfide interchange protein DsbC|uniref:thioredoxin fold domain-containing protein n=1 Tax=Arenimonas caeni TaxID=2058085 RepID=UPI002A359025|nr:thioredoxin fold domain-containing protein [Arenimonas caeni]MDY0022814.1 thioredoxin fold domain-containing protein [Arenimonas caeni]